MVVSPFETDFDGLMGKNGILGSLQSCLGSRWAGNKSLLRSAIFVPTFLPKILGTSLTLVQFLANNFSIPR